MAREYFCAYHSYRSALEPLTDAERGRLFTALLEYSETGEVPDLRGNERFVFPQCRWQIDRDAEKYDVFCSKQAENGKKGGRPRKPNETQKTQAFSEKPKKAKEREKEKNIEPTVLNPPTPLEKAISDFIAFRKSIKKPMTDRAVELFRKELDKISSDQEEQIAIIHQSIMNGWQSVYPLKEKGPRRGAKKDYPQRPFDPRDYEGVFMNFSEDG